MGTFSVDAEAGPDPQKGLLRGHLAKIVRLCVAWLIERLFVTVF
jgi:hypothetical protein